jgi:hypothetical protein
MPGGGDDLGQRGTQSTRGQPESGEGRGGRGRRFPRGFRGAIAGIGGGGARGGEGRSGATVSRREGFGGAIGAGPMCACAGARLKRSDDWDYRTVEWRVEIVDWQNEKRQATLRALISSIDIEIASVLHFLAKITHILHLEN